MLSLAKIAFTVAVVIAVIAFFKSRARRSAANIAARADQARAAAEAATRKPDMPVVQDLVACPKCGAYIAAGTVCVCEKA